MKQYGPSKEQTALRPLEQTILKDFALSKFIVCTDAGLSFTENREFNNRDNRAFITTQSIKKLKKPLKEWALNFTKWHMTGTPKDVAGREILFDITHLEDTSEDAEKYQNVTFYKERWIKKTDWSKN